MTSPSPVRTDPLAAARARAAELAARIDTAPDETTARPAADQLHTLLDELSNVAELDAAVAALRDGGRP